MTSNAAPRPNDHSREYHPTRINRMADKPYTTADEDPFNVRPHVIEAPLVNPIKKRRSSMLDKWILEQQAQSPDTNPPEANPPLFPSIASSSNPYLAYPDLRRTWLDLTSTRDDTDAASINSYDLVDDDDIPLNACEEPSQAAPSTPIPLRTLKSSRASITPSFRTISRFRSSSPGSPPASNMDTAQRVLSRLSLFPPRTPRSSTGPASVADTTITQQHARSQSVSTLSFSTPQRPVKYTSPPVSSKWRPTVLGHFHQPSISQVSIGGSEANYTSRPSISSGDTYATSMASRTTSTFESTIPSTPSKLSLLESIRLRGTRSPKSASASSFSVASTSPARVSTSASVQGSSCSHATYSSMDFASHRVPFTPLPGSSLDNIDDEADLEPPPTYRFSKHESVRSVSSGMKRVNFSSLSSRTHRKKKKLIVSGVGVSETRKFEGVKRWCESFGDIRQISRMPNGDLQIDFRDPEVADTVCRVRAKVFIAGVGSVQLSWIAGNKR